MGRQNASIVLLAKQKVDRSDGMSALLVQGRRADSIAGKSMSGCPAGTYVEESYSIAVENKDARIAQQEIH